MSDYFSVGRERTWKVPPVSIVSLGPLAIAGRSGDSIFWLANSPPLRATTSTGTITVTVPNRL
ncbi:MAG: hypothetical protein ACLP8S_18060 [Solirubrobacteraceae bacterium]